MRRVKCRTEKYRKSFLPNCINLWNNLDEETKNMQEIEDFKNSTEFKKSANELYYFGDRNAILFMHK